MAQIRKQFKEVYAPRTISKALLKALVQALAEFKPGLPTTSRKLKVKAIGAGRASELEGPQSWKVIDPHSLAELEQVRVELVLASAERSSCELHIEFRTGYIALSVADVETGWGKSVFEETRILLKNLGISSTGLNEKLRKAYGLLEIFQNVLLTLSVAVFALWLANEDGTYLFASLALLVAGIMPALTRAFHFLRPPRIAPIFQETVARSRNFPWTEATAMLAFATGVLQLLRALLEVVR
jgi:hypothetical protein